MATTTTNFGWDIPQSTDLVKDGATAIAALGQDIDTAMVDLKGGTTGQVLAKASGTDLDFSWVAQDDSNAIQNAIVDAKGDLISATAADTPARLAIGTTGQVLTVDPAEATGIKWASPAGGAFVGAVLFNTGDISISNNTFTAATFNSERVDTNGFHDTSTNTARITIPTGYGGKYLIWCALEWATSTSGTRTARLEVNGSYPGSNSVIQTVNATTAFEAQNQFFIYRELSEGDYINVAVRQTTGGTHALGGTSNGYMSQFGVQYLGA